MLNNIVAWLEESFGAILLALREIYAELTSTGIMEWSVRVWFVLAVVAIVGWLWIASIWDEYLLRRAIDNAEDDDRN